MPWPVQLRSSSQEGELVPHYHEGEEQAVEVIVVVESRTCQAVPSCENHDANTWKNQIMQIMFKHVQKLPRRLYQDSENYGSRELGTGWHTRQSRNQICGECICRKSPGNLTKNAGEPGLSRETSQCGVVHAQKITLEAC